MDYPYLSQWSSGATARRNDCGQTVVCMVLGAFGKPHTPDEFAGIDTPDNGTTASELAKLLQNAGISAQVWTGTGLPKLPAICLVKYSGFDRAHVQDVNYTGWHWLLVLSLSESEVVCHDPNFKDARINEGAYKHYSRREWDAAFIPYGASKIAVVWPEASMSMQATVQNTRSGDPKRIGCVVFADEARQFPILGLPMGARIAIQSISSVTNMAKVDVSALAGGAAALSPIYPYTPVGKVGYVHKSMLSFDPLPAPDPLQIPRAAGIGVHCLTSIKALQQAQAAGCQVYVLMNRPDEAAALATGDPRQWTPTCGYPLVMYRIYHDANPWTPADMLAQLVGLTGNPNPNKRNVIITLANEWDIGIPGAGNSAEGVRQFCDWTIACVNALREKGFTNVAWLTSSMGTPDFTNNDICEVIRQKIAPLWNNGTLLWTDMHLYSPTKDWINKSMARSVVRSGFEGMKITSPVGRDGHMATWMSDAPSVSMLAGAFLDAPKASFSDTPTAQDWFETRWRFLFTRCGFSPNAPGRVVSSEMGLDEGGVGGFPAHGYTAEEVRAYCRRFLQVQAQPLVVNGASYPSPFLAGAIYQADPDDSRWQGYRVSGYYPLVWSL